MRELGQTFFVPLFTIIIYCLAIIKPHWHTIFYVFLLIIFFLPLLLQPHKLTKVDVGYRTLYSGWYCTPQKKG
jgi:hypothetical protein